MVTLSAHAFVLLVLVSGVGVGAMMVWLALNSDLVERHALKRCAACGRLLRRGELCRCSRR
jgi:hypothetical protein